MQAITIRAYARDYEIRSEESISPRVGETPVDVWATKLQRVSVELSDGACPVPMSLSWWEQVNVTNMGTHEPVHNRAWSHEGSAGIVLLEPGRYMMSLPHVPGYYPRDPENVVVGVGETTHIEAKLVRW
jgi:hypothetical protein